MRLNDLKMRSGFCGYLERQGGTGLHHRPSDWLYATTVPITRVTDFEAYLISRRRLVDGALGDMVASCEI